MKRALPSTNEQWLEEIELAIDDAAEAAPFGPAAGTKVTVDNLFHLAPMVCLKFRGKKLTGRDSKRAVEAALSTYVANEKRVKLHPLMAFTLCYMTAHCALGLIDEETAHQVLTFYDERPK